MTGSPSKRKDLRRTITPETVQNRDETEVKRVSGEMKNLDSETGARLAFFSLLDLDNLNETVFCWRKCSGYLRLFFLQ